MEHFSLMYLEGILQVQSRGRSPYSMVILMGVNFIWNTVSREMCTRTGTDVNMAWFGHTLGHFLERKGCG